MLSSNTSAVSGDANYIEDVFSTYLYTGNDSSQSIVNGVNLSVNGGLTWIKCRNLGYGHILSDTNRGTGKYLSSNTTDAQGTDAQDVSAFNTTGFTVGNNSRVNNSSYNYASWTFRKQPKFFDIVTYTGTGSARAIAHNLGATPGCMIVKCTSSAQSWVVYHKDMQPGSPAYNYFMYLNATDASTGYSFWNSTAPTSTEFTVGTANQINQSGATYVAYLFASDAGGFGLSGTDNVITCGTYTGTGSGSVAVTLGYEPQWLLIKASNSSSKNWWVIDNMRGIPVGYDDAILATNLPDAEVSADLVSPTATGFLATNTSQSNLTGVSYIYVAIRRGPMKVPTDATKVFLPNTWAGTGATAQITNVPFAPDTLYSPGRGPSGSTDRGWYDRLRGINNPLQTNSTGAEDPTYTNTVTAYNNNGVTLGGSYAFVNQDGSNYIEYFFGRAPSFFDVVMLNNSTSTYTHNLTVAPELIFVKCINAGGANWVVYSKSLSSPTTQYLNLNNTNAAQTYGTGAWSTSATQFSVDTGLWANGSRGVSYLFATCPGVSKVGSYTGTGTTKQIDCGFAAGARFVLIKRTDSTGDWYVWDTARGIVSGNDPYLLLNSAVAEVTSTDYIDTYSAGFELSSTAPAALNASGGTYIFLAIA